MASSVGGMTVAELVAVLRANTSDFDAGMARAQTGLKQTTEATQTMSGHFQDAQKVIGGLSTVAAAGAVLMAQAFIQSGISMNASLETSELQFKTLFGGTETAAIKAKEHVAGLFDFAKRTPFETGPIVEASRMLQTFGKSALNTIPNLEMIGDASAATGASINELAFWTGRMYTMLKAGRPFGEASMRLQELAVMSPEVRGEMERMTAAGKPWAATWKVFTDDLEKFNGAMAVQATTWVGLTSTIKDTVGLATATVTKPLFDSLREALGALVIFTDSPKWNEILDAGTKAFQPLVELVKSFAEKMTNFFMTFDAGSFIAKLSEIGEEYGQLIGVAVGGLAAMSTGWINSLPFIGHFITAINPVVGILVGVMMSSDESRDAMKKLFEVLVKVAKSVGEALAPVLLTLSKVLSATLTSALVIVTPLLEFMADNADLVAVAIIAITTAVVASKISTFISTIGNSAGAFTGFITNLKDAQILMANTAGTTNATGAVGGLTQAFTGGKGLAVGLLGAINPIVGVGAALVGTAMAAGVFANKTDEGTKALEGLAGAYERDGKKIGSASQEFLGASLAKNYERLSAGLMGAGIDVGSLAEKFDRSKHSAKEVDRSISDMTDQIINGGRSFSMLKDKVDELGGFDSLFGMGTTKPTIDQYIKLVSNDLDDVASSIYKVRDAEHDREALRDKGINSSQQEYEGMILGKDALERYSIALLDYSAATQAATSEIEQLAGSFMEVAKGPIEEGTNAFKKFGTETDVTAQKVKDFWAKSLTDAASWSSNVKILIAGGISQDMITDIMKAGPAAASTVGAMVEILNTDGVAALTTTKDQMTAIFQDLATAAAIKLTAVPDSFRVTAEAIALTALTQKDALIAAAEAAAVGQGLAAEKGGEVVRAIIKSKGTATAQALSDTLGVAPEKIAAIMLQVQGKFDIVKGKKEKINLDIDDKKIKSDIDGVQAAIESVKGKNITIEISPKWTGDVRTVRDGSKEYYIPNVGWVKASPRAAGGPVTMNSPYLVGEKGPELFVPKSSGTIIANNKLQDNGGGSYGGGGVSVVINTVAGNPVEIERIVVDAISRAKRRGLTDLSI